MPSIYFYQYWRNISYAASIHYCEIWIYVRYFVITGGLIVEELLVLSVYFLVCIIPYRWSWSTISYLVHKKSHRRSTYNSVAKSYLHWYCLSENIATLLWNQPQYILLKSSPVSGTSGLMHQFPFCVSHSGVFVWSCRVHNLVNNVVNTPI